MNTDRVLLWLWKKVAWAASICLLVVGLLMAFGWKVSFFAIVSNIMIQIGGAFFFALTVGWVIDRVRDMEGYSVLWLFDREVQKAGVLTFYANRLGDAELALEKAFAEHTAGEVRLAGASLRLFLASGQRFYEPIQKMLCNPLAKGQVAVRALSCDPERNRELPVRSFIEDPEHSPSDWAKSHSSVFEGFEKSFFELHGVGSSDKTRARVITDLQSTRAGVRDLRVSAQQSGNHIDHREFRFAPYCTVIIFPDRAFYTPNLLSRKVPVNMPMTVFHKSSRVYENLVEYFDFLWWVSEPKSEVDHD